MLIISWIKAADHVCGAFCATRRGVGREMRRGVGREILLKEGSLFDAGLALVSFPGFLPQDRQPLSQGAVRSCWIEIMTNQILHSRLASEPPHVMLPPR